jgi:hypothetical protein
LGRRAFIVGEILSTEQTFVSMLELLARTFIEPLRTMAISVSIDPVLSHDQIDCLFSNIEHITTLNRKFCEDIGERVASWNEESQIGDLFLAFGPYFKMYGTHASRKPDDSPHRPATFTANIRPKSVPTHFTTDSQVYGLCEQQ